MALSFTPGNIADSMVDHRSTIREFGVLEFNEMAFKRALVLELKRTRTTKRPFILMLVSLAEIPTRQNGHSPRKNAVEAIAASIRDTDILGWYKWGRVVGVLLTEIDGPLRDAVDSVMERANARMASCLSDEDLKKLNIAVYLLPEKSSLEEEVVGELDGLDWAGRTLESLHVEERGAYH